MLGLDRRALSVIWTLFLFAVVLAAIYEVRHILMLFTLALFFAAVLAPVVRFLARFMPKKAPRALTLVLVYIAFLAVLVAITTPVIIKVVEQASSLASRLPAFIQQPDPFSRVPLPGWLEPQRDRLTATVHGWYENLNEEAVPLLTQAGSRIASGFGAVVTAILIPILSFFFLKDGHEIRHAIVSIVPRGRQSMVNGIFDDLELLLAQYIRALVTLAVSTFIIYFGFLSITGVAYAALLAGFACIVEIIPIVGPALGAAVVLLVAGVSGYPHLLWVLIFLGLYRLFQDYVLSPHLMASGVRIHPVAVLLGVLAGREIGGIPGMFFAVPTIAALRVVLRRLTRRQHVA